LRACWCPRRVGFFVANRSKEAMASGSDAAAAAAGAAGAAPGEVPEELAARSAVAHPAGHVVAAQDVSPRKESLIESIKRLKDQQSAMKAAKKELQKELKNACKRKNRLKKRARQLTDLDLLEVLQMRKDGTPMDVVAEPAAAAAVNDANPEEDARMSD